MLVRALTVAGFRNLASATLEPSDRFNVFSGDNGQGKTNLLEAIYLLGTLRSFRTFHLGELVRWEEREAAVRARVERSGLERVYEVRLGARKTVLLDGKAPARLAEYFGDFNVVLFAPEDLRVPRGSPQGRRRFLDCSVFDREVAFLTDAQSYARALKERNALLRDAAPRLEVLDVYDEQVARLGGLVVAARRRYLAELAPRFRDAYASITHSGREATVGLVTPEEPLAGLLAASRRRDLARRLTSVGPHIDDLDFRLDGQPARAFASQGQLRAIVLAWKTAEMQLLREVHGDAPVLLLDDVSSELDRARNEYLFRFLAEIECQCFITTTHPQHVLVQENRLDYRVLDGSVTLAD